MPGKDPTELVNRGYGADMRLHGKVAKLLNARQVAINIGKNQGVLEGTSFAVLNRNAGRIEDPDTGEVLGSMSLPKITVTVTHIYENFSVAEVLRTGFSSKIPSFFYTETTLKRSDNPDVEESTKRIRSSRLAIQ